MFTRVTAPALTEAQLFVHLHPKLAAWFRKRFTHFAPAQRHAVPEIVAGHSLLLTINYGKFPPARSRLSGIIIPLFPGMTEQARV